MIIGRMETGTGEIPFLPVKRKANNEAVTKAAMVRKTSFFMFYFDRKVAFSNIP